MDPITHWRKLSAYTIREGKLLHADGNGWWQDKPMHRMGLFGRTPQCSLSIERHQESPLISPELYAEQSSIAFLFPTMAGCILLVSTAPFSVNLHCLSGSQVHINTP